MSRLERRKWRRAGVLGWALLCACVLFACLGKKDTGERRSRSFGTKDAGRSEEGKKQTGDLPRSHERLGPWLRALGEEEAQEKRSSQGGGRFLWKRLSQRVQKKPWKDGLRESALEVKQDERLRILVEATEAIGGWKAKGLSIEVTSRVGGFASAWLSWGQIRQLERMEGLRYAEISRPLKPHLDVSGPMIRASEARLSYKLDGRDVIVGIIDTGIDLEHPAFRKSDGTTRVLAIMDYSQADPKTEKPPRFLYKKEIDGWLQAKQTPEHSDTVGHGTHIAGIAAGNGASRSASPAEGMPGVTQTSYLGIAPQADLVIVKAIRPGSSEFDSGDVLDSIAFVHQFAKLSKKPYVINLSLGGHYGGHDGQSFLERASAEYSGAGKEGQILVASAGNEGEAAIHAEGWLHPGRPADLRVLIPEPKEGKTGSSRLFLEIWYPEDGEIALEVISPRGERFGPFAPLEAPTADLGSSDGTVVMTRHSHAPRSASRSIGLLLAGDAERPLRWGTWEIRMSGKTTRWDAWLNESRLPEGTATLASHQSQRLLVGIPGTGESFLTVGSFNGRRGWKRPNGDIVVQGLFGGALSRFSSPGPTRDGRPKPEIVAPGIFVAAAAASSLIQDNAFGLVAEGDYAISQGTSQSAPHVAGAVALLLQKKPTLDTPAIRGLLIQSAKTDALTRWGEVFHPGWGFGKLDVLQALRLLDAPSEGQPDPATSTLGSLTARLPADGVSTTTLFLIPKDRMGLPIQGSLSISITSTAGEVTGLASPSPGLYQATLRAPASPAKALVTASIASIPLATRLPIDFAAVDSYPTAGCSCQTSPLCAVFGPSWIGLFLLFFWRRKSLSRLES